MDYMRALRNRAQHDLYPERTVTTKEDPISLTDPITDYSFPIFKLGDSITLSEEDIEALIFETRKQVTKYLIPYINEFLTNQ